MKRTNRLLHVVTLVFLFTAILVKTPVKTSVKTSVKTPAQGRGSAIPVQTSGSRSLPVRSMDATGKVLSSPRANLSHPKLPLSFEANRGQLGADVKFRARAGDSTVLITSSGPALSLKHGPSKARYSDLQGPNSQRWIKTQFEGANPRARVEGVGQLPGTA
ncbi:MAG: hypothetical protein ACREAC_20055, partial [Blastocatellia bacterium]